MIRHRGATRRSRLSSAVAVAVAIAGLTTVAGCIGGSGPKSITVTALFRSAVGIYETGDVVVLDHAVGSIDKIQLEGDHVRVTLRVRSDIPLPADVHAAIEAETVLGERRVVLSPSWSSQLAAAGAPRLADGDVIPVERTATPTEPDEALQSFNQLLASLDPATAGGLARDSAQILRGRGEEIGKTIDAATSLAETLASVDQPMLDAVKSLNQVVATLNQHDPQVRTLIDDFGTAVGTIADERQQLDSLLRSAAGMTAQVKGILEANATQLPNTIATLVATLQVVQANADTLPVLTGTLPTIAESFEKAYKPSLGGFFLKVNTSETLTTVVIQLLAAVGVYPGAV